MKNLINLLFAVTLVSACAGHQLEAVADKVPMSMICPEPDLERAAQLVESFTRDPERVIASMRKRIERGVGDAAVVVCELRAVKDYLETTGQQASDAYQQTVAALEALKKLAPGA